MTHVALHDVTGMLLCYRSPSRALSLMNSKKAVPFTDKVIKIITTASEVIIPAALMLLQKVPYALKKPPCLKCNIALRDKYTCQYCGEHLTIKTATVDHIIPRCKGGKTDWHNVVLSCYSCNTSKGDMPVQLYLQKINKTLKAPHIPTIEELHRNNQNLGYIYRRKP